MAKSAILVIDMIKGLEKWVPRKRMLKITPNIASVIKKARAKKVPVIYMVHKPVGKKGMKIYDAIKPTASDFVVYKNQFSSFYKTSLEKLLKKLKVKQLILTGVSTHWCLLSTALDASYHGYKLVLLADCANAPTDEWHNWAIKWMTNSFDITIKTQKELNKIL